VKLDLPGGRVSILQDGKADAPTMLVLAHGAGSGMTSDYMQHFAQGLADERMTVCRFNFLYLEAGKKAPDRQQVLEDTYRAVLDFLRSQHAPRRVFLGGKSMGGRIASHIAATGSACDGLIFLGYPLHPPGRPDRIRDAHLADVEAPMLFVEGTRDPFCPLDTLRGVIRSLNADLVVIEDGDHSLKVRKSSGRSTPEAWDEAVAAIGDWVAG
jgi:predicted alpha/beta-hydrolase family hydrolase